MDILKTVRNAIDEFNSVSGIAFQHVSEHEAASAVFFSRTCLAESGCWLWTGPLNQSGYGYFRPIGAAKRSGRGDLAHRFSHELFKGPIPKGLYVLHSCDTPSCVNPDHLRVGTQKENVAECIARGRFKPGGSKRGAENTLAKLTEQDVIEIRASSLSVKEICRKYGIDRSNASLIINGKTWTHVPMPISQENVDAR